MEIALLIIFTVSLIALVIVIVIHTINKKYQNNLTQQHKTSLHTSKSNTQTKETITYTAKESLLTDCEKEYFKAIKEVLPYGYTCQPQINLASIIDKKTQNEYINELFRNIDFGIFDSNYKLISLIEINDRTHETNKKRMERDKKVKDICKKANIPLITFWTKYGVQPNYIKYCILKTIYPNQ